MPGDRKMSLIRSFVSISVLFLLVSCAAGPSNLIGLATLEPSQVTSEGAKIQNLFIATSRLRSENAAEFFSGERAKALNLANVDVTIPPVHTVGKLEQPRLNEREDVAKHFTIAKPLVFDHGVNFAAKLNDKVEDIDLNFEDYVQRINSDLVGKYLNIASRCSSFIAKNNNKLSETYDQKLIQQISSKHDEILKHFETRNFSKAVRLIMDLADITNKYINDNIKEELRDEVKTLKQYQIAVYPRKGSQVQSKVITTLNPNIYN